MDGSWKYSPRFTIWEQSKANKHAVFIQAIFDTYLCFQVWVEDHIAIVIDGKRITIYTQLKHQQFNMITYSIYSSNVLISKSYIYFI